MDENLNPYQNQTVSAKRQDTESRFSFTLIAVVFTLILALLLVGSADYNVSLWQDGAKPPLHLSLKILGAQGVLGVVLVILLLAHLVATVILLVKQSRKAGTAFMGFAFATLAIIFTMFYDQGSIFFQ